LLAGVNNITRDSSKIPAKFALLCQHTGKELKGSNFLNICYKNLKKGNVIIKRQRRTDFIRKNWCHNPGYTVVFSPYFELMAFLNFCLGKEALAQTYLGLTAFHLVSSVKNTQRRKS
jgi:hypothetical protein